MKVSREFAPMSDRYRFDFGQCSYANGFAQIDTGQDASYYGTWCSPSKRIIVNYCEGDVTITQTETDAEFATALRELDRWATEAGHGPARIDPGFDPAFKQVFEGMGLLDMLH